jgi:hypothetical protein
MLLTLPLAIVALGLLSLTVVSLLRTVRRSVVASVPVREEQRVHFAEAGEYALSFESNELTGAVAGLKFGLTSVDGGAAVPLHRAIFRTRVSSFTRARLELYSFTLPKPGTYSLHLTGPRPSADSGDAIIFTRRVLGILVMHILALIAMGAMLVGSIVASGLAIAGP